MTHERWLPLPDHPEVSVSDRGNARLTHALDPLTPFRLKGMMRIRIAGKPMTLHNLVASLFLPDKPPDATHAFFLTPDRENCAVTNLSWAKPERRPIERRSGRPMSGQLIYALKARAKKGA